MLAEDGQRSRSHGLHRDVLRAQAEAVGAQLIVRSTSWSQYEIAIQEAIRESLRAGAIAGVFGDLDFSANREWEEGVCRAAGVPALLPLWHRDRLEYMTEVIESGFVARIVAIRDGCLPLDMLGRIIDAMLLEDMASHGIDLAGESGEYHTVVVDGPIFRRPVQLATGDRVLRDGVWFVDMRLKERI